MAKLKNSKDKEKVVYVKYNEKLARQIATNNYQFLEAVGRL